MSYRDKKDVGLSDEDLAIANDPFPFRVALIALGVLAAARLVWWLVS